MIAKVTAPPYASLNDTQKLVADALRGKPKTADQLATELQRNYHVINRALNDLKSKNWVEVDPLLSGGRSNAWKLKQIPSDGIELLVDTGLGRESVSFNRYFESIAKQLANGKKPRLERDSEGYYYALAALGYHAAREFLEAGSVTEASLLEARSAVQRFIMALEEAHSIATQIVEDERLWHADLLANGVLRKTDRHLSPGELVKYGKMITGAFSTTALGESETETEDSEEESEEE